MSFSIYKENVGKSYSLWDRLKTSTKVFGISGLSILFIIFIVWLCGVNNPHTPAGYVGYLTQGAVFGKTRFYGMQTGPTSSGITWMLYTTNVSITPYTYNEKFSEGSTVLAKNNLKIGFEVHIVWKIRKNQVKDFIENYSTLQYGDTPDKIAMKSYVNYVQEPLRTYSRDEVQKYDGLAIKDNITPIGEAIYTKILALCKNTPFDVQSVVVGNIQYPPEVVDAVSKKIATNQLLEQKSYEIEIEKKEKEKRIVNAEGVAKAMDIIQVKLTPQYLQHEAIEAQKAMVGSPNHTTIYIPVGPMGVPITGTFPTDQRSKEK